MLITHGSSWGKRYSVWGKFDQFHAGRSEKQSRYAVDCMEHGRVSEQNGYNEHSAAVHDHLHAHEVDGFSDRGSGCNRN